MARCNASDRMGALRAGLAALALAALAACGGGGTGGAMVSLGAFNATQDAIKPDKAVPQRTGLLAHPVQQLAASSTQVHAVLAAGALDDGGHAVVWLARPAADAQAQGELFVQRFDADSTPRGGPLPLPQRFGPENLAVLVHGDGSLSVATAVASSPDAQTRGWDLRRHRFNAAGQHLETTEIASVQNQTYDRTYWSLLNPAFARWPDGRHVLGWAAQVSSPLGTAVEVSVQGFDAQGQLQGERVTDRDAQYATFQLATVPQGGFVLGTLRRGLLPHQVFMQVGLRQPLALPVATEVDPSVPRQALLLPLHEGGHVLFTGRPAADGTIASPVVQSFGADGAAGDTTALPALPDTALALADGGYLTLTPAEGQPQRQAQRYTAQGQASGDPVQLATGEPLSFQALLRDGSVALAWTTRAADGSSQVVAQRLQPVN